jgi:hypothetical protein
MKPRASVKSAAIAMAMFCVSFGSRADACSCLLLTGSATEQVEQSMRDSDDVFVARLKRSALKPDRRNRRLVVEDANFEVIEVFKGSLKAGQIIRVYQVLSAGTCGQSSTNEPPWMYAAARPGGEQAPIKFSKEWLIYSNGAAPFELNRCTRSSPLNVEGNRDVKVLRGLIRRAH